VHVCIAHFAILISLSRPGSSRREEEALEAEVEVKKPSAGETWRACGIGVCVYRTKYGIRNLKQHKACIHAIDIVWHYCLELECEFRAKVKNRVKMHRALVHDIGVTWHDCPEPNCTYRRLHLNVRSDIRNSTSPADESRIVVADTIKVGETFVRKYSESRTKSVHNLERV